MFDQSISNSDLDRLLATHHLRLKKYIHRKIDPPVEADEVVQETLISAADSFPGFKNRSHFFTWLCGIANHEISDYYRKKRIKTILFSLFPALESLASQALGPEQKLLKTEIEKETEKKVAHVLAELNEGYAEVLRLKYYQCLSIGQIATKFNESYKAIESRLSRARKAFASAYTTVGHQRKLALPR